MCVIDCYSAWLIALPIYELLHLRADAQYIYEVALFSTELI